jgi:hypothetical protein
MRDASAIFAGIVVVASCLAMAFGLVDLALVIFGAAMGRLLFMALELITGDPS